MLEVVSSAEAEIARVVWWSLILGGLVGGVSRSLLAAKIELPYTTKLVTGQIIISPGFIGDLLLGPVAAFVLLGASASTFDFQTSYDSRGFWAPFISSIVAGAGAGQLLQNQIEGRLKALESSLTTRTEQRADNGDAQ